MLTKIIIVIIEVNFLSIFYTFINQLGLTREIKFIDSHLAKKNSNKYHSF